jgi:hypothetical protein
VLHALVSGGEQPFTGFVAFDDGAGPATEAGIAAGWGTRVNLDWAFAIRGVGVKFVERTIVASPWIRFLKEVCPDFLCCKKFDWV